MQGSTRHLFGGALYGASLLAMSGGASADCTRHVYNRSPFVLVASQAGEPSVTIRPGASRAITLSASGNLDLAGYCAPPGSRGDPAALGQPAVQDSFSYRAVLDRCDFAFGHDFFDRELGRGFLPRSGTQPFTLNSPKQGDIALYADGAACLPGQ